MRPRSSGEEAAATFERRRLTPCLKPAFLASGVPATRLVFLRDQALRGSGDWNAGGTEGRNGARGDCRDCARVRSCACWGSGSGSSETEFDARLRGVFLPEGPASASGARRFPCVRGRPVTRGAICLGVASVACGFCAVSFRKSDPSLRRWRTRRAECRAGRRSTRRGLCRRCRSACGLR